MDEGKGRGLNSSGTHVLYPTIMTAASSSVRRARSFPLPVISRPVMPSLLNAASKSSGSLKIDVELRGILARQRTCRQAVSLVWGSFIATRGGSYSLSANVATREDLLH